MSPDSPRPAMALPMLCTGSMNASLQAKIRRVVIREFYRHGYLTWEMKLALRWIVSGR
jgi:hypothetical protein